MQNLHDFMQGKPIAEIIQHLKSLGVGCKPFEIKGIKYVLFNYGDFSIRGNALVNGCRGTIWKIDGTHYMCVRAAFDRFFNYEEPLQEGTPLMLPDITSVSVQEKHDGTLLFVSYIGDEWIFGTRNLNSLTDMNGAGGKNMTVVVEELLPPICTPENKDLTFMFELCTPWNQVVIQHSAPHLILLGVRNNKTFEEMDPTEFNHPCPPTFEFKTMEECIEFVQSRDPTLYEGFVLKWGPVETPSRLKLKSADFVALSKTSNPTATPEEVIIAGIIDNDVAEVLAGKEYWTNVIYPKIASIVDKCKKDIDELQEKVDQLDKTDAKFKSNYGKLVSSSDQRDYFFKKLRDPELTFDMFMKDTKAKITKYIIGQMNPK